MDSKSIDRSGLRSNSWVLCRDTVYWYRYLSALADQGQQELVRNAFTYHTGSTKRRHNRFRALTMS